MQESEETTVELTVVGADRKGVVASFTNVIFRSGGNIEAVSQNVVRGLFGMHLEASYSSAVNKAGLLRELKRMGRKFGMDVGVHYREKGRRMNLAVMVTKEDHALGAILDAVKGRRLRVSVPVIIGSDRTLREAARDNGIPFFVVNNKDQETRETRILRILQRYEVDAIALARYMSILSANFVWRYPNKIINIHPSLLPAFPGALAYDQAYERGARIIGCTAHFVTMDLDEGPIIWQQAFQVEPGDTLQSIKKKGRELEARVLLKALELYAERRLEVRWGRVHIETTAPS